MINKELFKEYADLKIQIKSLEEKSKELEPKVLEQMQVEEVEQVKSDFGTFSITKRKSWKYSENVKMAEDAVKAQKSLEEKEGIATFEEKQGLMFKQSSEKVDTNDKKSVII